ncbi:hypothetical protein ILUMI_07332 [Ignelater luminosus]|uniref:THAP-type domain-containing protein n=1 Tax=Ignelater luminosus TaxID=2038154 RepID=A0A8K0DDQ5_IGNLU|nr:hypothetical protein ILUMI_07332 [Ignelater luminosus]
MYCIVPLFTIEHAEGNADFQKKAANKYCIVPGCESSSYRQPKKLFLNVPTGDIRKNWLKQMRCDIATLEEDVENNMRIKLDPTAKIRLKKGPLPRFFNCQPDKKRSHAPICRPAAKQLLRARILATINMCTFSRLSDCPRTHQNSLSPLNESNWL